MKLDAFHIVITRVTGATWDCRVYAEPSRMFLGAFHGEPAEVRELLAVFRTGAKARGATTVTRGLEELKEAL